MFNILINVPSNIKGKKLIVTLKMIISNTTRKRKTFFFKEGKVK